VTNPSFTYDDNIRFRTTDEISAYGFITTPRIQLEAHTPRSDLSVGGSLDYAIFPSERSLDYFNQRLDAAGSHRTERHRFDLGAVVQNAATLTTEDEDTGEVFSSDRRVSFSRGPSWGYVLSERDTVGVRGGDGHQQRGVQRVQADRQLRDQPHLPVHGAHELAHGVARVILLTQGVREQLDGLDVRVAVHHPARHHGARVRLGHRDQA
jgi:hypothetical protein